VDVSTEIWKLLGSSVHSILDKAQESKIQDTAESVIQRIETFYSEEDESNSTFFQKVKEEIKFYYEKASSMVSNIQTEKRLYMNIGGYILSGKPDWIDTVAHKIEDYKVTSVWKVLKEDYEDWIFQLNSYKLLAEYNDFKINCLQINAILKDWKKFEYEQKRDSGYPNLPIAKINIPVWDSLDTLLILIKRIQEHEALKDISDSETIYKVRPCTNKEKWHGEDKYAVKKQGNKKASAVFPTKKEAHIYITDKHDASYFIEDRLGQDKRCEEFCLAKPYCHQYKVEHGIEIILPEAKETILPEIEIPLLVTPLPGGLDDLMKGIE